MKQAELWYANLDPVKGSEQAGWRPVLIISGNLMNEHLNTLICCPLTTKIKNYHGNLILEPNSDNKLPLRSEVLVFHIRSLSKDRLVRKIGRIGSEQLEKVKNTIQDILKY